MSPRDAARQVEAIGPQQRRWHEDADIDTFIGWGTHRGQTFRCRRCGDAWWTTMPGLRCGPCLDDAIPNVVGEG